ncbi:bifunctional phosphatase PAP2/diacylglycerol kinase family protein [Nocardia concava]|uniref:bifunctional phosphatase PAP2/diacylglycerol kinase family protein n=1 Tax=Nocardia concava TaxID=257281 RepID=UPI00030A537C|nr:bifunctional phosphatase PAP2/diacylglycerol kinase family protein [Nocardia concava]
MELARARARRKFRRVGRADRALTAAVARLPASAVDDGLLMLTRSADFGVLWLLIAGVLGTRKGPPRRAAVRGVVSLGATSLLVDSILKPIIARRRPAADLLPVHRRLTPAPASSSFPSGHSAAAAAFATAVALENPRAAAVVGPLAAIVAYSRVHTGVHWGSDVLVGAAVGSGVALATRRWWPAHVPAGAHTRTVTDVPALPDGEGLLVLVNPASGDPDVDPAADIKDLLPAASIVSLDTGEDPVVRLETAYREHPQPVSALGVAGGDGTLAAAATVALRHGLPLAVFPTGTLNHFARDLGVLDPSATAAAVAAGEAVTVGIARVDYDDERGPRTRHLINTAGLGTYPDMLALRREWRPRWGRWPAFAAALLVGLRRARPLHARIDGRSHRIWVLFLGNGPYYPRRAIPAFRERLDSGLLDVRWVRADLPFSRVRAGLAVLSATIGHTKVYAESHPSALTIELPTRTSLAADGEVIGSATRIHFRVAGRISVYRATGR